MGDRYEKLEACHRFDAQLSEYLEGQDRPAVPAHAKECSFCGAVLADLEQIRFTSRHLPLQDPPSALWSGIRAQLIEEGTLPQAAAPWRRWFEPFGLSFSPAPITALACLVFLCSILINAPGPLRQGETARGPSTSEIAAVAPEAANSFQVVSLARKVGELEISFEARETSLEPGVEAAYRKSLGSLNSSITECLDSIRREPSNPLTHEYLLSAYARKAEVLVAALEFNAR